MKKLPVPSFSFLQFLLFILNFVLFFIPLSGVRGQSTTISPGIVLPQMTSTQRTALSATNGMLVFDTNTQSYWLRSSGSWTELPKTAANTNFWQQTGLAGNEIKNTNSGGFWSANPTGLSDVANHTTNPPTAPVSGAGTRMMWIPSRSAFRVGTITDSRWDAANIGLFSFASGLEVRASGDYSTAMGYGTSANSELSTAVGYQTTSVGLASTAMGANTTAGGNYSTAMGNETIASGEYSTAMGNGTTASGYASTAMGNKTKAIGDYSIAMGFQSIAASNYSTVMGIETWASSYGATAMGKQTQAIGEYSTAMGYNTIAWGDAATVIGKYNIENYDAIFIVGNGTAYNNRVNILTARRDNNFVGIGVDNPIAHLHVGAYGNVNTGQATYFYPNSTALTHVNSYNGNVGIYANAGIVSQTFIAAAQNVVSSDIRIKNIINRSDNVADLDLLKKLQITNYRMKDKGTWGEKVFKKVIAQEVEKIYPEAVSKQTSVIPDIYTLAEKVNYDANKKELTVSMSKVYDLKVGDKIELVHPEKGKVRTTISAVSGNSFTVKDWLYETDKIFVFGREVDDFRVVDYEALSMLGISAVQQLAKENEELKSRIERLENLEKRLIDLEVKNKTAIVLK